MRPTSVRALRFTILPLLFFMAPSPDLSAQGLALEVGVQKAYLADLATLERKFVGLAEAFSPAQYDWRPAPGIRSVREVLVLIVAENATLIPHAFGRPSLAPFPAGQPGFGAVTNAGLQADKTQIVEWVKRSFVLAREAWEGADPNILGTPLPFFGGDAPASRIAFITISDQHEHLGQLVAYARMIGVVPPWSKAP